MKFYYASADGDNHSWRLDRAEATHRLMTYYYTDGRIADNYNFKPKEGEIVTPPSVLLLGTDPIFMSKRNKACQQAIDVIKKQKHIESLVMDSGAWTYMQPKHKVPDESLWAYVERYAEFCAENRDLFTWCAEMDVDRIYGMDFVERSWDHMVASGVPVIRVWHTWRGIDTFCKYCDEMEYVGVGGPYPHQEDMAELLHWAYKNGNKVHVFGRLNYLLHGWPCYSADATSWMSPEAWGQIVLFDSSKGQLVRKAINKTGLDLDVLSSVADIRQKGFQQGAVRTVIEMKKYEEYLTRSWAERGVTFDEERTTQQRWREDD